MFYFSSVKLQFLYSIIFKPDSIASPTLTKKRTGESFTELILRLLAEPEQKEIIILAGTWKGSKEETDSILNIIYENRKNVKVPRHD